jgi:hypothetical protein
VHGCRYHCIDGSNELAPLYTFTNCNCRNAGGTQMLAHRYSELFGQRCTRNRYGASRRFSVGWMNPTAKAARGHGFSFR